VLEIEFLAHAKNFAELRERLRTLGLTNDLALLDEYARHVATCWFRLAEEHLAESIASIATSTTLVRTAYSRAYYAAYNASKAVRYMTKGVVSLKGDDHKAAPDLPSDFVDAASWGAKITTLYEHRLRADYDNWAGTTAAHTLSTTDVVMLAKSFVNEARRHLVTKHGLTL
jgi:uncharacterized protein (UPF0332 family)